MLTATGSITSDVCAFVRAWYGRHEEERQRGDYLAYDLIGGDAYNYYYELMDGMNGNTDGAGPDGDRQQADENIRTYVAPIIISRMRFLEKQVKQFAGEHERIQYVILGAGADTFAYRSDDPSIEIYEVDHPDTQRVKIGRMKERSWEIPENVHYVPVNFETDCLSEKLAGAGYDPAVKTVFSIMGVSYYLSMDVMAETLKQITKLASGGSLVIFDYLRDCGRCTERIHTLMDFTESLGEVMQGGYRSCDICGVLAGLGFEVTCHLDEEEIQELYFSGSAGIRAFDHVSLLSAVYRKPKAE